MNPDSLEYYWNNMLLLEDELSEVFRVIEPVDSNLKTYSPVMLKLILELGAELDSAFKSLVRISELDENLCNKEQPNMGDYRSFSRKYFLNSLLDAKVEFKPSGLTVDPWKAWRAKSEKLNSIPAWKAYTGLKHNRGGELSKCDSGQCNYAARGRVFGKRLRGGVSGDDGGKSDFTFPAPDVIRAGFFGQPDLHVYRPKRLSSRLF